jgi:hypothetical protein
MITITKYISYAKYAIDRYFGLFHVGQLDPINQMMALALTPLNGTDCTYKYKKQETIKN